MRTRLLLLVLVGCSRSPTGAPTPEASVPAQGMGVQLAPPDEPGQKLTVTGTLLRAEDETPVANHRFLIYQADATGGYRATNPDDERTARLSADVTTDAAGRFVIRTILPGVYGTPPGDPHLHIEVSAAQPAMHVAYFDGFLQEDTIRWQKTTEQAHIIPVSRGRDGELSGHLALRVRQIAR